MSGTTREFGQRYRGFAKPNVAAPGGSCAARFAQLRRQMRQNPFHFGRFDRSVGRRPNCYTALLALCQTLVMASLRMPPRGPISRDLRRKADKLAGFLLSDPQDIQYVVLYALLEFDRRLQVRRRAPVLKRRPDSIPLAKFTSTSFCTDVTYWFQYVLSQVLLETMGKRPGRRQGVSQDQLIATYLLVLIHLTIRKWVDPQAIALASILLGASSRDAKHLTNSPETEEWFRVNKNRLLKRAKKLLRELRWEDREVLRMNAGEPEKIRISQVIGERANDDQQKIACDFFRELASWHPLPRATGSDFFEERLDKPHAYDSEPGKNWNDHAGVFEPAVKHAIEGMCVLLEWFPFGTWFDCDRWIVPDFIAAAPPGTGHAGGASGRPSPPGVGVPPSSSASGGGAPCSGGGRNTTSGYEPMDPYDHELAEQEKRRRDFQPFDHALRIHLGGDRPFLFDAVGRDRFQDGVSEIDRIRVFGRDGKGDLLLAVLPLPDPSEGPHVVEQITLEGGQRIRATFHRLLVEARGREEVAAVDDESEEQMPEDPDAKWSVEISYCETRPLRWLALALRRLQRSWDRPREVIRQVGAVAATLVVLVGAGYGATEYGRLLERYADVVAALGFADPFEVKFSAVGRNSLEVTVQLERNIVEEVWVDWGDSTLGREEKLYPLAEVSEAEERPEVRSRHDYGPVDRGGLRTLASVRIVPRSIPEPRPATLTDDKLNPKRELLVLPVGLILDPPAWRLDFVAPSEDEIVSSAPDIELRVGGVTAPIHLLARETSATGWYRHLATLAEPAFAEETTLRRSVDLAPLGPVGSVDIRALSAESLNVDPEGRIAPESLPEKVPEGRIHLTLPAAILEPASGATVGENETVRLKSNIDGYVTAAIRPVSGGTFWIQSSGLAVTGDSQRIPVIFGGVDDFELYVGITQDPNLFVRGAALGELKDFDSAGKKVEWVGPIVVHRKE